MATRALQDEVARLNRAGRDHRRALEALRELDVRLGAVGGDGPGVAGARAALTVAVDRARAGRPVDLVALTEAVGEVEDAARRAVEREYVERTLTEILGGLGYEVVDGFEKVVPNGGRLVRKPGWSHHGVMVEVDGEEITLDVVRTATEEATATAKLRDEEIEEAFCGDVPGVLEELAAAGIGSASVHRIPPGIVAVREVEGARKVQTRTASARRRKPQERKL